MTVLYPSDAATHSYHHTIDYVPCATLYVPVTYLITGSVYF